MVFILVPAYTSSDHGRWFKAVNALFALIRVCVDGMAKGRMVNGGYNKEGAMNWSNIKKYAMSLGNREITTKLYKKREKTP